MATEKTVLLGIRLTPRQKARLADAAKRQHRTMSNLGAAILIEWCDKGAPDAKAVKANGHTHPQHKAA